MSEKQLSSSTLLFRQGAMSWTFPVIIHERKLYNSLGTCTSIFTSDRSAGSAGNGVMGWSDWMARLKINAALNTCCVSSYTPLRLSSSGTPFHRQLFLFFFFLCLVQPQTSLNNWPWLYFTAEHIQVLSCWVVETSSLTKSVLVLRERNWYYAEHILRFCTLVRSVKDQSHVKVPFHHVTQALQTVPSDSFFWQLFPVLHLVVTCHTYGTMWFNRLIIQKASVIHSSIIEVRHLKAHVW